MEPRSLPSGRSCGTSRPQRKKEAEAARAEEPAAPQKKAAQKTTRHQPPQTQKEAQIEREVICDE